ncbi:MAG TPA: hypothetical protein VFK38_10910 [Candidatus Limnocylindrales bacterium]|nr:hypothetical protein [Candidatus Limnocylindrales bacterium]
MADATRGRAEASADPAAAVLVGDTAWTPGPDDPPGLAPARAWLTLRLAGEDVFSRTSELLDAWAAAARIEERWSVGGTTHWIRHRLGAWRWLEERLSWLGVLDDLVARVRPSSIEVPAGLDQESDQEPDDGSLVAGDALAEMARLIAARDGLPFKGPESPALAAPSGSASPPRPASRGVLAGLRRRLWPSPADRAAAERARRRAEAGRSLERFLAHGRGRLLALTDPRVHQVIDGTDGPRRRDPFLGSVLEALDGTSLAPAVVLAARHEGDREASPFPSVGQDEVQLHYARPEDAAAAQADADAVLERLHAIDTPLVVAGVDLGPLLSSRLEAEARRSLPGTLRLIRRAVRFLADCRPAGLLLVNEYGRADWVAAARLAGVPVAALQHGIIHPWHAGYIHPSRAPELPLPDRLYLFGDYERRLLTSRSVYREGELRVVGSPRLDLAGSRDQGAATAADERRTALRRALGVAQGDRLVVISGTSGDSGRRLHLLPALAAVFDRPLPGVHVVVKLHPGEKDEGPYRRLIEGIAQARGFRSPPISIVQRIDLYELLAAADAHLGVHSTVLTDAVAAGTGNLIAATQASGDLLGYVDAGVALPVRDGAELLAGLDALATGAITETARRAFLADHYLPGPATPRIAQDLRAWLTAAPARPAAARVR